MNTTVRKFAVGLASAALVASAAAPAFAADDELTAQRWAGADRYDTAIAVAKKIATSSGVSTVYVANGTNEHLIDAIAAGQLPDGPLLLVNDDPAVQAKVAKTIIEIKASKVVAIGGKQALPDAVLDAIHGSATTERVAGDDRYATAVAIAERLEVDPAATSATPVYLANGQTLVDALVAGQLTNDKAKGVILLTDGKSLPKATADYLAKIGKGTTGGKVDQIIALGGTDVVTDTEVLAAQAANAGTTSDTLAKIKELAEAEAKADIKANGYFTAKDGLTVSDFLAQEDFTLNQALQIQANFPHIPASIAKVTTKPLFKATAVSGGLVAQDLTYSQANTPATYVFSSTANAGDYIYRGETKGALYDAGKKVDTLGWYLYEADGATASAKLTETDSDDAKWTGTQPAGAHVVVATTNATADANDVPVSGFTYANATPFLVALRDAAEETADTELFGDNANGTTAAKFDLSTVTLGQALATADPTKPGTGVLSGAGGNAANVKAAIKNIQLAWPKESFTADTKLVDFLSKIGVTDIPEVKTNGFNTADNNSYQADNYKKALSSFRNALAKAAKQARIELVAAKKAQDEADAAYTAAKNAASAYNVDLSGVLPAQRLGGETRIETALAIAKKAYGTLNTQNIYFANAWTYADAAVAGLLDNNSDSGFAGPVLLVEKDSIPADVAEYVKTGNARTQGIAIGGTAVISDEGFKADLDAIEAELPKLTVTTGSPTITGGATVDGVANVATATPANVTVGIPVTVTGAPSGSNVTYEAQFFNASTGQWVANDTPATITGGASIRVVAGSIAQGVVPVTVTSDKTATAAAKVSEIMVRLVVVAKKGSDAVAQTEYTPIVKVNVSNNN